MAKAATKQPPSLAEKTKGEIGDMLVAWSEESVTARKREDLAAVATAQTVCDLLLDLRAAVSEHCES